MLLSPKEHNSRQIVGSIIQLESLPTQPRATDLSIDAQTTVIKNSVSNQFLQGQSQFMSAEPFF